MKIYKLTHKTIRPYGAIIDAKCTTTRANGNGWGILFRTRSTGWRIAYLIARDRSIKRLECHDSYETFEPIAGKAVIALAKHSQPRYIKPFLLDKPVVIKPGVWHSLYTISKESHIKIVENMKIKTKYYNN